MAARAQPAHALPLLPARHGGRLQPALDAHLARHRQRIPRGQIQRVLCADTGARGPQSRRARDADAQSAQLRAAVQRQYGHGDVHVGAQGARPLRHGWLAHDHADSH